MKPGPLAGILLGAGVVMFVTAAFLPISRVYMAEGADARWVLISESVTAWRFSQVLFTIGALIAGGALGWAALNSGNAPLILRAAPGVLLGIGAIAWTRLAWLRAVDPQAWASGSLPAWHFVVYTLATIAGVAAAGLLLWATGPRWLALTLLIVPAVYLAGFVAFRDLPPFLHYLPMAAVAYYLVAPTTP